MLFTRRQAICSLAATSLAASLRAADGDRPRFTGLDHAQFEVPDGPAAAKFYGRMFGGPVWKHRQAPRWYVMLGHSYLVLEESKEKPTGIDHFSFGIAGFEMDAVHRYLDAKALPYKDLPSGRDTLLTAPDGPAVELSPENSWKALENQSAQKVDNLPLGEAIFQPLYIRGAVFGVKDSPPVQNFLRKTVAEDSAPATKTLFDIGESQLDIRRTIPGQPSSEGRIIVRVARFEVGEMQDPLLEVGAEVLNAHNPPYITFRDINGLIFDVTA